MIEELTRDDAAGTVERKALEIGDAQPPADRSDPATVPAPPSLAEILAPDVAAGLSPRAALEQYARDNAPGAAPRAKTLRQHQEAQRRQRVVEVYLSLQAEGYSPGGAVALMRGAGFGESRATLDRYARAWQAGGFEGLLDRREFSGRPRKYALLPQETAALRDARLTTNRTATDGSTPEAVRLAARRGQLRPELAAEFFERERTGRIVPASVHREIAAPEAVTVQARNPREAVLDYLGTAGALMWVTDRDGTERFCRVGDVLEADDATVNFHVCVPWEMGGDPCSERWGVRVARFQWLVAIDRASRFVPGWSYTMRPRSSYRAEDITHLFHALFREHGVWSRLCLERGAWEAAQVTAMIEGLGIQRLTAYTPHQKPYVEGLFGLLWTKLSDLPGQVGRYRGEMARAETVAESCRRGATDPRDHFPLLGDVLPALHRVCAERNAQPVRSAQHGTWVPEERWLAQQAEAREKRRLRPLPEESAWMFAPCARRWKVQGGLVGGSIQLMEGLSVRFDFAAEWLPLYHGAEVTAHFDPFAPRADATLVLAGNHLDRRAGEVLGVACQVNKTARHARRMLGWGDDADLGPQLAREQAIGLRREVRTIRAGGRTGLAITDLRTGGGEGLAIERPADSEGRAPAGPGRDSSASLAAPAPARGRPAAAPRHPRGTRPLAPATQEEFARRTARTARLLAATAELTEPVTA